MEMRASARESFSVTASTDISFLILGNRSETAADAPEAGRGRMAGSPPVPGSRVIVNCTWAGVSRICVEFANSEHICFLMSGPGRAPISTGRKFPPVQRRTVVFIFTLIPFLLNIIVG